MKKKYIKIVLLFILSFFIFILIFLYFNKSEDFISNINYKSIIEKRSLNDNLIYGIKIDNVLCSYDFKTDHYYISLNKDINKYRFLSQYNVKYTLYSSSDNIYIFLVYNNKYYKFVTVEKTSLPIINLFDFNILSSFNVDKSNNNIFKFGTNNILNDNVNVGVQIFNMKQNNYKDYYNSTGVLSIRGSSSKMFNKKSYKLKLNDELGFNGIASDKTWVLDALYMDKSKVRNMLSSDLWNLINDNQEINNDIRGQYVEVFYNSQYIGLYCLKEKVDKSVTKISDDGLLLKAFTHLFQFRLEKFFNDPYDIVDNQFLNLEIKKSSSVSLNSFINKIYKFHSSESSYELISETYDINNFLNYKILVSLICGQDNVTSNQYYSMVDSNSNILITPWDMDLTWGLFWHPNLDIRSQFIPYRGFTYEWMYENIIDGMDEETLLLLKQRYFDLRRDIITVDTINNYLYMYEQMLDKTVQRDGDKWYKYDLNSEIEIIKLWAQRRIEFLDDFFNNLV